jgi:hypothetical protein
LVFVTVIPIVLGFILELAVPGWKPTPEHIAGYGAILLYAHRAFAAARRRRDAQTADPVAPPPATP